MSHAAFCRATSSSGVKRTAATNAEERREGSGAEKDVCMKAMRAGGAEEGHTIQAARETHTHATFTVQRPSPPAFYSQPSPHHAAHFRLSTARQRSASLVR